MLRKKQNLVVLFIGISVIGLLASLVIATSFEKRPNIVLIMTDDLAVTTLDFLLDNDMMPNFKKNFVDEGIKFSNSFVTNPLCCPSRATSLTGLYPHNHGILSNKPILINDKLVANGGFKAFNDSSTIATWLDDEGYTTGYIGKYLNGYSTTHVPPGWDYWLGLSGVTTYQMYNFMVIDDGIKKPIKNEYQTDFISRKSIEFIENSDKPFFLYISTLAPHSSTDSFTCDVSNGIQLKSVVVSPKYDGTLDDIPINYSPSVNTMIENFSVPFINAKQIENQDCLDRVFKDMAESMLSVDELIGKVFKSLEDLNETENTIVIFTSDNGFLFGEHGMYTKGLPYDEATRVPLFIKTSSPPTTIENLIINNDLAPTIADFARVTAEIQHDGKSLVPLIQDNSLNFRDSFLIEGVKVSGMWYHAIRGQDFLYIEYRLNQTFTEFYDLKTDPYQQVNIADCTNQECLEKIEVLGNLIEDFKTCKNGSCQKLAILN